MLVLREHTISRSIGLQNSPQARRLNLRSKGIGAVIEQEMAQESTNQRFHQRIFEKADSTSANVEVASLRVHPSPK